MIPGNINTALISGAEGGGYQIQRSLRFNSSDSAFCDRTFSSTGNRKTWTYSLWVKKSQIAAYQLLFSRPGGPESTIRFSNTDTIEFFQFSGGFTWQLVTTQVFRDPSSWYHLVFVHDSSNATASDRVRIYVNGQRITTFSTASYPSLNFDSDFNTNTGHTIGSSLNGYLADIHFIDGQALTPSSFAETDATTGQWIPKLYSGSYGTNGFKLNFSDNSTTAALGTDTSGNGNTWTVNNLTAAEYRVIDAPSLSNGAMIARGASGGSVTVTISGTGNKNYFTSTNGINWTWQSTAASATYTANYIAAGGAGTNSRIAVSAGVFQYAMWNTNTNFDSTSNTTTDATGLTFTTTTNNGANGDSLVDTPTSYGTDTGAGGEVRGNYATLNPIYSYDVTSAITFANGNLDIGHAANNGWSTALATVGVTSGKWYAEFRVSGTSSVANTLVGMSIKPVTAVGYLGTGDLGTSFGYQGDQTVRTNGVTGSAASISPGYVSGDIVSVAVDMDSGKAWYAVNGTWINSGNPATGANAVITGIPTTDAALFAVSLYQQQHSAVANFGQRAFAYTAPSGFKALCDTNLPAPVVAKSSDYFQTVLYTGNGSTQTISGLGFSPDLVWMKVRSAAEQHEVYDSVRGVNKALYTDYTDAEGTYTDGLTSFNSDGFSLGSRIYVNGSSKTYVGWTWDAGSSTVTNTQGSITSQVRANASAGFSVVSWTGGTAGTVGHGLNVAPQFVITKSRSAAVEWRIWHSSFSSLANYIGFSTNAVGTFGGGNYWQSFTSSTIGFTGNFDNNTGNMIAYCFAPVAGYSSAFSITGNGSTDGSFCHLGFRPRLIIYKRTDTSGDNWFLHDTARDTYNVLTGRLFPNTSGAESTNINVMDVLSNGFKLRTNDTSWNASGGTYVGFAWAESPFAYARAR